VSARRRSVYAFEDALVAVRALSQSAAPYETGGLIVSVATDASVWITAFVEVEVSERHLARFVIPAGATHPVIDRLRANDARIGYLGDWHSHPADVGPSGRDVSTLADLVLGSLGRRRLLGLVRRTSGAWEVGLWGMTRLRRPVRVECELAGPVPPIKGPTPSDPGEARGPDLL
jgi:hypothetical protein